MKPRTKGVLGHREDGDCNRIVEKHVVREPHRARGRAAGQFEDLGEHELPGLVEPERLFQLAVPGLAAFGVGPQHVDDVAAKAARSSSMQGNPVALTHSDLRAIVLQAL